MNFWGLLTTLSTIFKNLENLIGLIGLYLNFYFNEMMFGGS